MIVLRLHQWQRSFGVGEEIKFAMGRRIPINFVDLADL